MTELNQTWQDIIWREWRHCDDKDYARRLYQAVPHNPLTWFKWVGLGKTTRPDAAEVEAALHQACISRRGARHVWERRLERLDEIKHSALPVEKLIANLQDHHWLERFIARHALLHYGGEAVPSLLVLTLDDSSPLQETATWLLQSIAADTTSRLAQDADKLLCSRCLVFCHRHSIQLPWQPDLAFYGCRACRRSRSLRTRPAHLVVVLDSSISYEQMEQNETLWVNWFQYGDLFDFDRVEIIRASDEEVERFAVQVGNDTDPFRQPRYRQMGCVVAPGCQLSENTRRILASTFGQVESEQVSS